MVHKIYCRRDLNKMFGFLVFIFILEMCAAFRYRSDPNECSDFTNEPSFPLLHQAGECGEVMFLNRIMGGENATLGELPFMALLLIKADLVEVKFCGGTIINKRYILTAAHCAWDAIQFIVADAIHLVARLGEHDIENNPDCDDIGYCAPPVQDFYVEEIIPHEKYNKDSSLHDIALLRLNRDIIFNKYISPVCLPFECKLMKQSFEGKTTIVAGWGHLSDYIKNREVKRPGRYLQKIHLPVNSRRHCERDWNYRVPETKLCAGGMRAHTHGKDACMGDSGGPLLYTTRLDGYRYKHFQVGIVSTGEECTKKNKELRAGFYTRVTSYIPWILQHVRE